MCLPAQGVSLALGLTSNLVSGAVELQNNKRNQEYRTQVAINNAQTAKNEALRQQQLGIEESRKEKIAGLSELNKKKAINSASGFDLNSQTNLYAYEDTLNTANSNAQSVKREYNYKANSYFERANSYLNDAKLQNDEYNSELFSNALGGLSRVADKWFDNYGGGNNDYI